MSDYQRISGIVTFKQPQTPDAVIEVLEPLSSYFGWEPEKILANEVYDDESVELTYEGSLITEVELGMSGEMSRSVPDLVEEVAAKLHDIAEAGVFELEDHSKPSFADGMSSVWFGQPDEIKQEQRRVAILKSQAILEDVGLRAISLAPIEPEPIAHVRATSGVGSPEEGTAILQAAVKQLATYVDGALSGIYAQHHYIAQSGEPPYEAVYEWVDAYQVGDVRTDERLADLCWDRGLIDEAQRGQIQRGIESVLSEKKPSPNAAPNTPVGLSENTFYVNL